MNQSKNALRTLCLSLCLFCFSLLCGCSVIAALGGGLVPESATEADLRGKNLSAEQLEELQQSTQLVRLDIRDNPVTAGQYAALHAALPGCEILWSVPIGGAAFDSDSTRLVLPAVDAAEIQMLRYFPNLTDVDATSCTCYDALLAMSRELPACAITWSVPLGGKSVSSAETTLDLSGADVPAEELSRALSYLPALAGVDLHDTGLDGKTLSRLMADHPNIRFEANLAVCGKLVELATTTLDLTQAPAYSAEALLEALAFFPDAETINLTGLAVSLADIERLSAAYPHPQLAFLWDFELAGVPVSGTDTEIDLSGKTIGDVDAFAAMLQYLPALKKINMSDCGLTDEQMEALCGRFPDIKFVWYVTIGRWQVRTDAQAFSTGNERSTDTVRYLKKGVTNLTTEDIAPLKYCTDLVALDIGHKRRITDISVIRNLPKLRFLIIAMEGILDISPVASCTELEYLETFQNNLTDLSPLLSLKKLTHHNCSTNAIGSIEVLKQMTQLERLWCIRCGFDKAQLANLQAALPNCVINASGTHSTSNGWRQNDLYREMQALFGLPALD